MTTVAEFLLARITEDEEWATLFGCTLPHDDLDMGPRCRDRILVECIAKRELVRLHSTTTSFLPGEDPTDEQCFRCGDYWPCAELRVIAMVYASHSDYQEQWSV